MRERITYVIAASFTVIGLILFLMSFSTGYYLFGEMNSTLVLLLLLAGMIVEIGSVFAIRKWSNRFWPKLLVYIGITILVTAAILLMGDRVEGIGNCIITDYDSGHGGEEAIYYSIGGAAALLFGTVANIVGSFMRDKLQKK